MTIKVITASYNDLERIKLCLESIRAQEYDDFDVCVVDDASPNGQGEFIYGYARMAGWSFIQNPENYGALFSQMNAIRSMNCDDDDIIVFLDGDDVFNNEHVLEDVARIYNKSDLLVTYGNYRPVPPSATCPRPSPYPQPCVEANDYRNGMKWGLRFNHLRTAKYAVAKHITDKDCQEENGDWYHVAGDTAFMIPCLELAGGRYKFIDRVFVDYTSDSDQADWRLNAKEIDRIHRRIFAQTPKEPIC